MSNAQPKPAQITIPNSNQSQNTEECLSAMTNLRCFFCGYSKHPRFKCPARDAVCKLCGKQGHFQKVCRSNPLKTASITSSLVSSITLAAAPQCLSNAVIQISVNGVSLSALIDTGSSDSYVSNTVVQKHGWNVENSRSGITMASTNLKSLTNGHCFVHVLYKNHNYTKFKPSVLSNLCADIILGHDFLRLHKKLEIPFNGDKDSFSVCSVAAANIEPPALFINLTPDCSPVATKSRRHSDSDESFIEMEVQNLLKNGIIEPSHSPWRAQVLVTTNERHKRRMVVDYSQTINRFTLLDAYPLPKMDEMVEKVSRYCVFSTLDLKSAYHQIPIREEDKIFTAFEACGNLYQFRRIPFGITNGVSGFQSH